MDRIYPSHVLWKFAGYIHRIHAEQDDIPVRGNAMCSGDPALDRKVENEILARLELGDCN